MSAALYNLAAMTVASTGTGTITLGSAATINGVLYLSFVAAGVPDGALVYYSINDVGASEVGSGTYTAAGTTLTRSVTNSTNGNSAINMTAAAIVRISFPTSQSREVLTTTRTYYVNPSTGNDSNTGLASGAAFLTIQKAINVVSAIDIGTNNVLIQLVGAGTASASITISSPWIGSGTVTLDGNGSIITASAAPVIHVTGGGRLTVQNAVIGDAVTTPSVGLWADAYTNISVGSSVTFAKATAYQLYATGGAINFLANYAISGGALAHLNAESYGSIRGTSLTVTLTGTPAFGGAFVNCITSTVTYFLNTFVGSATGSRYSVVSGGFISVNGAGTTYLPGNAAGSGTNFGATPWGLYA